MTSTSTKQVLAILLGAVTFLSAASTSEEKHLSVYSPVAIYSLPVEERAGHEYIGLLELLEPLGRVSSVYNGRSLKLQYNALDAEFFAGRTHARIHGRDFDFSAPFLIENSRGLVPINSLAALLPRFLGAPVNFHESALRLFVGEVGVQVSFQLDAGTPPHLALNFTAPVNPTISTEPGKLRMTFKREPLLSPGSQSITFDDKVITQASYSENDGNAELEISAAEPLMANFSNGGKTIVVSAIESQAANGIAAQKPPQPTTGVAPASAVVAFHRVLAAVDAAHGGEERGAALTNSLAEKDVTLGFARLLRHELEQRGFAVLMLRDGDSTSTTDQHAASANAAHAAVYISLHATSQGNGAHAYTALMPVEGTSKGEFHAWNAGQTPALPVSRIVAAAIVGELQKKQFPARGSAASLQPLNNVFMPAVAVELAPGPNGIADLTSANYQQRAAAAIADAVLALRDRLGAQQ